MRITRQILGLAAASLFGIASPLLADPKIDFHGGVIGCFVTVPLVGTCPVLGAVVDASGGGTLTYTSDTFTGTTSGLSFFNDVGFGVGGGGSGSTGSFGKLSVAGDYNRLPGTKFLQLDYYFNTSYGSTGFPNAPGTPTVPGNPALAASVFGAISGGDGAVLVTFGAPALFTFTHGNTTPLCTGGSPNCTLDNTGPTGFNGTGRIQAVGPTLGAGQSGVPITGDILIRVESTVPEPASIALFATGLVGLIPVARYRRRNRA
jgi:hypothetical protein